MSIALSVGGCGSKSEQNDNASDETLFGVQLAAQGDVPSLEVAVKMAPAVQSEAVVQPLASVLGRALASCSSLLQGNSAFRVPVTLQFDVRGDRIKSKAPTKNAPIPSCLLSRLNGETLAVPERASHEVTVQLVQPGWHQ